MRRFLSTLLLAVILIGGYALIEPYLENMLYAMRLASMPAPGALDMPVQGVRPKALRDTWHAERSGGRKHEGIDIFAKRGTPPPRASCCAWGPTAWADKWCGCWGRADSATTTPTSTAFPT